MTNADYLYFLKNKADFFAKQKNKFVLIRQEATHGFFTNYVEALQAALTQFGDEDFLIQEVTDEVRTNLSPAMAPTMSTNMK